MGALGFGNRTVGVHLMRGGLGALALAAAWIAPSLWLAVPLVGAALWAWKGCPTCWAVGLLQTIANRQNAQRQDARYQDARYQGVRRQGVRRQDARRRDAHHQGASR